MDEVVAVAPAAISQVEYKMLKLAMERQKAQIAALESTLELRKMQLEALNAQVMEMRSVMV